MAMSLATLKTELKAMALFSTEPPAVTAWTSAFAAYFQGNGVTEGAESNLVYIAAAAIPAAKAAMAGGLAGMSASGAGAAKIAAAIALFWGALVPATAWPTTTAITPPALLAGLAATLQTTFTANKNGSLSKNDSMDAIATDIHAANQGGTATWPGIGPQPIT